MIQQMRGRENERNVCRWTVHMNGSTVDERFILSFFTKCLQTRWNPFKQVFHTFTQYFCLKGFTRNWLESKIRAKQWRTRNYLDLGIQTMKLQIKGGNGWRSSNGWNPSTFNRFDQVFWWIWSGEMRGRERGRGGGGWRDERRGSTLRWVREINLKGNLPLWFCSNMVEPRIKASSTAC